MSRLHLLNLRARWLFSNWLLWTGLALLVGTLLVLFMTHSKQEPCLRWWGMVLQFLGIFTVVHDLRSAQRHFGQPGVRERFRMWLQQLPRAATVSTATFEVGTFSMGDGSWVGIRVAPDGTGTVEERLQALELRAGRLGEEIDQAAKKLSNERAERVRANDREADARAQADQAIERKLAEVSTGSFSFSLFGVVWLAVGLVLSSTSVEAAKWLGKLAQWTAWSW